MIAKLCSDALYKMGHDYKMLNSFGVHTKVKKTVHRFQGFKSLLLIYDLYFSWKSRVALKAFKLTPYQMVSALIASLLKMSCLLGLYII
jgi:hypothetical protein